MPKRRSNSNLEGDKIKRRNAITLQKKYEIISSHETGCSVKDLCARYSLSSSTVCTILKNKEKYLNEVKHAQSMQSTWLRSKQVDSIIPQMEKLLTAWISDETQRLLIPISYATICAKALSIFKMLKDQKGDTCKETFVASSGWFDRYKRRAGLHNIKVQGGIANTNHLQIEASENVKHLLHARNELAPENFLELQECEREEKEEDETPRHPFIVKEEEEQSEMRGEDDDVPIHSFTENGLEEAFDHLAKASAIFQSQDPDYERSSRVVSGLKIASACYQEILIQMKKISYKQMTLAAYRKQKRTSPV